MPEPAAEAPKGEDVESYALLKTIVLILTAMWAGSWLTAGFAALGATLPAYIGAMLVAAVLRNLDDATGAIGISQRLVDDLGNSALALFLVIALMTLRLWDLVGLALPLAVMLVLQVAAIVVAANFGREPQSVLVALDSPGPWANVLQTNQPAIAGPTNLVVELQPGGALVLSCGK